LIVVRVNALYSSCVHETVGEWMGPGGPHGLQLRWRASFGVRGGFDSLALPPSSLLGYDAAVLRLLIR
jgi:hypothetical protein